MTRIIQILLISVTILYSCEKTTEYESPLISIDSLLTINMHSFDLAIDKQDNKWIATNKGLMKYNGFKKELFTRAIGLNSDTVYEVVTDHSDNIWVRGNSHEICQVKGRTFTIHSPSTLALPKMHNPTALMVDAGNHVWVGAYLGLYEYDGTTWKHHYYNEAATNLWARKIFPDPENDNALIILTYNHTIIRFDGSTYKQLDTYLGIEPHLIECIAKDPDGTIYMGLALKGLLKRTRNTNSFLPVGDETRYNTVYGITMGMNNRIWLATSNGLCYVENGKVFDFRYSLFGRGDVEEVAIDSNGKPWYSNYTGLVTLK